MWRSSWIAKFSGVDEFLCSGQDQYGQKNLSSWHMIDGSAVGISVAGKRLVDRWLEAPHVFHWHVLSIPGFQVLVEDGKNLIVQDLELADSVNHLFQWLGKRNRQDQS